MPRTREEIQQDLSKIDEEINRLAAENPAPSKVAAYSFPWIVWILAIVCIGAYFVAPAKELLNKFVSSPYDLAVLIAGIILGLMALNTTVRILFHPRGGKVEAYRESTARTAVLQKKRKELQQELLSLGK